MGNLLRKMRQENEVRHNALALENREVLNRMMRYLSSTKISVFALEDIRHDLIGMAMQAQQRGERFADALGMPERQFCDELAQNSPRRTLGEWVGTSLITVLWLDLLVAVLGAIVEWQPGMFVVTLNILLQMVVWIPAVGWVAEWLDRRNVYTDGPAKNAGLVLKLVLLVGFLAIFQFAGRVVLFTLPAWVVLVPLVAALAAAYWYRARCYRQAAARYGWAAV